MNWVREKKKSNLKYSKMQIVIHRDFEQGSDEWHAIRDLRLTASNATAIAANGAGLITYVKRKIREHLGVEGDHYTSSDMERGNRLEPIARTSYEFLKGVDVEQVGFISKGDHIGISPDGLVGEDGLIEIKARNNEKHFDLLLGKPIESGVRNQIQMQLFVSGRKWCDFVSYNPKFKKDTFIYRFYPDQKYFNKLEIGLLNGEKMIKDFLTKEAVKFELKK
jgi:hypothetical protein